MLWGRGREGVPCQHDCGGVLWGTGGEMTECSVVIGDTHIQCGCSCGRDKVWNISFDKATTVFNGIGGCVM